MKIMLTGHTSGIGKATYDLLTKQGHDVIGLSRKNGYDINNSEKIINTILKENPDMFINNAYSKVSQTYILKELYDRWKQNKKHIINICSVAATIPEDHPDYLMEYATEKRNQREFCNKVNFEYSKKYFNIIKCKLTNLNFDYTKTNFKSKYDKRLYPNLLPEEVAEIILFVISNKNICVRDMSFHSTRKPELV